MKKAILFVLLVLYQLGYSQQITHVEYWFNDDFANRVFQSVSADVTNQVLLDIPFPDNGSNELNAYFHCRFLDNSTNWSPIYSQQMNNNADASTALVQVQYWFDTNSADKTIANCNSVVIGNALDHQELDIPWDENAQELLYRFKSSYNNWTSIQTFSLENAIFQNNQIESVEYWFGDDFAERVMAPVTLNANGEIDLSIAFPDNGTNELNQEFHCRFVDQIGNWSAIYSQSIQNNSNPVIAEVEVEYWFDEAFANRTLASVTTITIDDVLHHQELDIAWPANAQTIHYRFKSQYNMWSSILSTSRDDVENTNNQIVAVEYWLNDDFAARQTLTVDQTGDFYMDQRDLNFEDDQCNTKTIYLRYKDKMNRWSSIFEIDSNLFLNGSSPPGVTLIVHGFTPNFNPLGTAEVGQNFIDFAKGIQAKKNGDASIYVMNTANGKWEIPDNVVNNPNSSSREIILVYDWAQLSNNFSKGYLEASADVLFASLIKPNGITGYSGENILTNLNLPKHFIGHSRGCIVLLQLLHRMGMYFPEARVEQLTTLDPHPADNLMNDQTLACIDVDPETVFAIKTPFNVVKHDNYYRKDNDYEGLGFDFDGVRCLSASRNIELSNDVLNQFGCNDILGTGTLAHSNVHSWYFGKMNLDTSIYTYDGCDNILLPCWYDMPMISDANSCFGYNSIALPWFKNRTSYGYNDSRIGGGYPCLPDVNDADSLAEMNAKHTLRTIMNGDFNLNNDSGWFKYCGNSTDVSINDGKAEISNNVNHSVLKHSLLYFGPNYNFLQLNVYEANSTSVNAYPSIKISFFDKNNVLIGFPYIRVLNPETSVIYAPLPNDLVGEVGTFQIEYGTETEGSFKVDEIMLTEVNPISNLKTINLKLNLEGFYDAALHEMRPVLLNQGTSSDATLVDNITVELINPTTLITAATVVVTLKTNGTAVCNFPSVADGSYYIVIKHRNAIQTWSATAVVISASPVIYDFSDAATKAYGSNMVELEPGVYGLYTGDLNQDGNIDNSDYTLWENDSNAFLFGFYATDLNGDGNVDNTDYTIWEANSNNFIYSIRLNLD